MSFLLLALAIVWVRYLETKTRYPPIMRISIVTRHHYRVAVVYFVVVSTQQKRHEGQLDKSLVCVVLLHLFLRRLDVQQPDLLSAIPGHEGDRVDGESRPLQSV
jgi:hypothetical protein